MQSLVPSFIVHAHAAGLNFGNLSAVVIQVDVSGFTQLTTVIMNQDRENGGEVVANIMRQLFTPLIEEVQASGGFVAMFAGDAFTAIFPFDTVAQPGAVEDVARHALSAALHMRQRVHETIYTEGKSTFRFQCKVGIAAGDLTWRIFPHPISDYSKDRQSTIRSVFSFAGSAVKDSIRAIKLGGRGDCVSAREVALFGSDFVESSSISRTADFVRIDEKQTVPAVQTTNLYAQDDDVSEDLLDSFVPSLLSTKRTVSEFRQVLSLFVGIEDVPDLASLSQLTDIVYELQANYGGYLNALRLDDKGNVMVMFWGAPLSSERDVMRATQFAYALMQKSRFPLRMGLSYRWLYAGLIGSETRQDYTCYGGGTSFAARLMTIAKPGQILLDEACASRISASFWLTQLESRMIKGFDNLQTIFRLDQAKRVEDLFDYDQAFVGRVDEFDRLYAFLNQAFERPILGHYLLRGEAGSGKSRLVNEIRTKLKQVWPDRFLWCYAQADELASGHLNIFVYFLRKYFSQFPEVADDLNKERFLHQFDLLVERTSEERLAHELVRVRSFIAALLGLYWPKSLYDRSTPELRQQNIQAGLMVFFRALCQDTLVIFQAEDTHWIDPSSTAFIEKLFASFAAEPVAHGFVLIETTRVDVRLDSGVLLDFPESAIRAMDHVGSFSEVSFLQFSRNLLGGRPTDELVTILHQRTEGNPFFIEQTILYLQENSALYSVDGRIGVDLERVDISPDIRSVLLARIDRLLPAVQSTVQTAAVLGREFSLHLLRHMLTHQSGIEAHIYEATQSTIWIQIQELRFLFKHALLRDVVYQMQLTSRRQELHRLAVRSMLTLYQADLTPYYGELAYHAELAMLWDEAVEFGEKSGDTAVETFRNERAIHFYGRCVEQLKARPSEENDEKRFRLLGKLAEVYRIVSDYDAAKSFVDEAFALALTHHRLDWGMELFVFLGRIARRTGDYAIGTSYLMHAEAYYAEQQDDEKLIEVVNYLGVLFWNQELLSPALEYQKRALSLYGTREKSPLFGSISLALGICWLYLEDYHQATSFCTQAYDAYDGLQDTIGITMSLETLAYLHYQKGEFDQAIDAYQQTERLARDVGWKQLLMRVLNHLGALMAIKGVYERAEEYFAESLDLAQRLNAAYIECWIHEDLATYFANLGRYDEALDEIDLSLDLARKVQSMAYIVRGVLSKSDILWRHGRRDEAIAMLQELEQSMLSNSQMADLAYTKWRVAGDTAAGKNALHLYEEIVVKAPKWSWVQRIGELKPAINGES